MMKFTLYALLVYILMGCSGFQVEDTATNKLLAYAAGKTMAISVHEVKPEIDPDLTSAWVEMMERNTGNETVTTPEMVAFFNESLRIIAGNEFDKYGLINDLAMLMSIYSAEFNDTGQMIGIQPVPMEILKLFEQGYSNGRAISRK